MSENKKQHFVPQHYLRNFKTGGSNQISLARIDSVLFVDGASISTQCQEDYFYDHDNQGLDDIIKYFECNLSPLFDKVSKSDLWSEVDLEDLKFLTVLFYMRTRKHIEEVKQYPKKQVLEFIRIGIEKGEIPEPNEDINEDSFDFTGVASSLIRDNAVECWLEMCSMKCKLLEAEENSFFITSDNPVVLINPYFDKKDNLRSYVGFSRSGLQVIFPITPKKCLFYYDPFVYRFKNMSDDSMKIHDNDVSLINSLQVQNAEKCVYFSKPVLKGNVKMLLEEYSKYRQPLKSLISEYPTANEGETVVHVKKPKLKLTRPFSFVNYRKKKRIGKENRRDEKWSKIVRRAMDYSDYRSDIDILEAIQLSIEDYGYCPSFFKI